MDHFHPTAPTGLKRFVFEMMPGVIFVLAVGAIGSLALYSRDQSAATELAEPTVTTEGEPQAISTDYERSVTMITLEDGTRCAVLEGLRVGSIDCDWQGR